MASQTYQFSLFGFVKAVFFTALVAGLSYWLWQDVKPLLRPLKGDVWSLVKDLNILVNGAGLFVLVTAASLIFDRAGAKSIVGRLVGLLVVVGVIAGLVLYGRYYSKEIMPLIAPLLGT